MSTLDDLGCDGLPNGFDFDIAMTLRFLEDGRRIAEIPIPTHYGDEISRVPLMRTGLAAIRHALRALGVRFRTKGGRRAGGPDAVSRGDRGQHRRAPSRTRAEDGEDRATSGPDVGR
jgi:hypothetical protein